jgi:hypothetical protein
MGLYEIELSSCNKGNMRGLTREEGFKQEGVFANILSEGVGRPPTSSLYESGGVPASTRAVAPPARIDWPAIELGKNCRNLRMNQLRVGIVPLERSHSSGHARKSPSREVK